MRRSLLTIGAALAGSLLVVGLLSCAANQSRAGDSSPVPSIPSVPESPISQNPDVTEQPVDARLVAANTRFGFKLFSEVAAQSPGENVLISPSSVSIALSMVYNGASGDTQRAIAEALQLEGLSLEDVNQGNAALEALLESADPKVKLAIANSLWSREGVDFRPDFLAKNREFYNAEVTSLDFSQPNAPSVINDWVNRSTEGKIPTIVERLNPEDVLFLVNAIYFKGTWSAPFNPSMTQTQPFYLPNGDRLNHPLMSQSGQFVYAETDQFQAVNLPYGNRRFSMVVFLPKQSTSLEAFQQTLTAENWQTWNTQFRRREGMVKLPRFNTEFSVELNDALKSLGMAIAFDPDQADFSAMINAQAFINRVQHKTFIEVNEQGTEAAGSTGISIGVTSAPIDPPFQMVVDRPFFYAIQDNQTGSILFMGTVVNPSS
ncbi:serpin family protein [Thermoleptolyngbya sichuanensis XZ-Cy5]|uniref:serpin family protein n=1 Tax=Thermoleptolyngbya sichuanensis TaxID=2885951 RepID=UPI00240E6F7B|nr:serpin family protein [Thermoleptolyngbya sichuanensis]MDG2617341.1 serpin family protein [Thermoleptolyngbya sichuanensis XZ-Cy5]